MRVLLLAALLLFTMPAMADWSDDNPHPQYGKGLSADDPIVDVCSICLNTSWAVVLRARWLVGEVYDCGHGEYGYYDRCNNYFAVPNYTYLNVEALGEGADFFEGGDTIHVEVYVPNLSTCKTHHWTVQLPIEEIFWDGLLDFVWKDFNYDGVNITTGSLHAPGQGESVCAHPLPPQNCESGGGWIE